MPELTEEQRKTECLRQAWMIAMSGAAGSWRDVERIVTERGWPDAPRWLEDSVVRQKMDDVCVRVRQGRQ